MLDMFMLVIILTPTQAFLALTETQRVALLQRYAAPIQEWTGADGGVVFSERVSLQDGTWIAILVANVRTPEVTDAFRHSLDAARQEGYLDYTFISGQMIGVTDVNDAEQARLAMERIFRPFLEP